MNVQEQHEQNERKLRALPAHLLAVTAADPHMLDSEEAQKYVRAIKAYQTHPYSRVQGSGDAAWHEVWRTGEVSLSRFGGGAGGDGRAVPVLLIPSLINKSYIFDLLPDKSFAAWLRGQGFDVYILDWGNPRADVEMETLDRLVMNRLCPAIRAVHERTDKPVDVLGYCMGGTLLAAAALHCAQALRRLIFMAAPWDFFEGELFTQRVDPRFHLRAQVQVSAPVALQSIESKGYLPVNWIQSVFAAVNADRSRGKFVRFLDMDPEGQKARLFVALEDWLNDGVDLPAGLAKECVTGWFGQNRTGRGEWVVGGQRVVPEDIRLPSLVVAAQNDRLVPEKSALALAEHIAGAEVMRPEAGHIGMMTSSKAEEQVWVPVRDWLCGSSSGMNFL